MVTAYIMMVDKSHYTTQTTYACSKTSNLLRNYALADLEHWTYEYGQLHTNKLFVLLVIYASRKT